MKKIRIRALVSVIVALVSVSVWAASSTICEGEAVSTENVTELRHDLAAHENDANFPDLWQKLSPQQQSAVWANKLRQVLTLDWSEEERDQINWLLNKVEDPSSFATPVFSNDEFIHMVDEWTSEVRSKFGWSDEVIYSMVVSLKDMNSK